MITVMMSPIATVMDSDSSGFFIDSVSSPNVFGRRGQDTRRNRTSPCGRAILAPGGGRIGAYLNAGAGARQKKAPPGGAGQRWMRGSSGVET